MMKPKVSVVIPIYNSAKFLQESIESVIDQTYSNMEIICVNDGSTDNSLEILKKFSDKIKIIDQKNSGLASALNSGIEEMSGVWFKWFSPDDKMYPFAIETLVDTANSLGDNTIIYSNWDIINQKGKLLRSFSETNYNDLGVFDFNVRLLDGQQINVNTTLIPKSLFENSLCFNTQIDPILVDYDFFLHAGLIYQTRFYLVEKSLIKYRIHEGQLSHKKIIQSLDNLILERNNFLLNLDKKKKKQYIQNLDIFRKRKPISKKSLEAGLKLFSTILPNSTTDKILVFYLNKIRKSR